ncbi:hypothetical protein [Nocardia caishijiensis]|uniref:HTH marR-type domain-containing protein n=1 Tax=Nocardia caishijiensis TaxID=184756 RepID=A0ABQ6YK56_9NOCA|nr:hypothetical protein [Nocardia caishijiensis]KAF0845906.1 hypothetical protein FNL39_106297 [Nocardia caishijiensis]
MRSRVAVQEAKSSALMPSAMRPRRSATVLVAASTALRPAAVGAKRPAGSRVSHGQRPGDLIGGFVVVPERTQRLRRLRVRGTRALNRRERLPLAPCHADSFDGPVEGISTVAAALAVDQPRASKLVAAAVAAGAVRRVADQSDGRRSLLELTERGTDILAAAHHRRQRAFDRAMAGWTSAERTEFARLLARFVDAID